mmetsp:Transcript_1658/g.2181  ORF Transcript_1658/g.2181 Transcript_1658/m.2181 type:complete len:278 (+) Transcript_1658:81-914(+)
MDRFLSYACRSPCSPNVDNRSERKNSQGRVIWILVIGPSSDDTKEIAIASLRTQHGSRFATGVSQNHINEISDRQGDAIRLAANYSRAAEEEDNSPHMLVFTAIPDAGPDDDQVAPWETYARRASGCVVVADAAQPDWLARSLRWTQRIAKITPHLITIILLDLLDFTHVGDDDSSFDEDEDEFEIGAQINRPKLKFFAKNTALQPFVGGFFWNRRSLPTLDDIAADAIATLVRAIDTDLALTPYRIAFPSQFESRRSCDVFGCFRGGGSRIGANGR